MQKVVFPGDVSGGSRHEPRGNTVHSKSAYLTLCFLLFLPLASNGGGDVNILVNPGFEAGMDGWADRNCAIAAVTSPVHGGSGGAKAYERTADWQGIKQSLWGKLVEGKPYKISGWIRLDNAPSGPVALSVEQQDDGGTNYHNVASATATNDEWIKLSGEFTLTVTGALSVLDLYFEGPAPGVDFYVDDVSVLGPKFIPPPPVPVAPEATGRVDVGARRQKIEGLGASGAFYTSNFLGHAQKTRLYELLFKDLGLDIFRIRNTHDIDETAFREMIEIAKGGEAALGRDLKIMVSSWSPPVALKSNNSLIGGTLAKRDGKFAYSEFAQWWQDGLKAYAEAELRVDYISIQNELNYEAKWDSCKFAPTESADAALAGHDVAFDAVWQKLNAETGADAPKMLAPETTSIGDARSYIESMSDLSRVYGYAHHLYDCSDCGSTPDRYLSKMVAFDRFNAENGGKPVFQTEYEFEPNKWSGAMNTALLMHNSLTAENVSGYLYWDLFWGPGSGLVVLEDASSFTIQPAYRAFKQYSAFIDADWQRVDAATDSPGLRISAFVSPDEKKLTAIIINTTPETEVALTLSLDGFSASRGEAYRSSETEECVRVEGFTGSGPVKLPAKSITTLSLAASE
ncbi:MAG: carbohydrate binding domain-containing protein [Vicinamibacteria bacterium]|nr:carbohydrate binding domain-containing protein [Vicinamibacteria bacterium]